MLEFLYTEILVCWNPCALNPLCTEPLVCRNCHILQVYASDALCKNGCEESQPPIHLMLEIIP